MHLLILLTWIASTTSNVDYNIYRGQSPGVCEVGAPYGFTAALEFSDTDVVEGETYYYAVSAFDGNGESKGCSNEIQVRVLHTKKRVPEESQ